MGLLLVMNRDLAAHMAIALHRHRQVLDQLGRACPDELEQIERSLAEIARSGQQQSGALTVGNGSYNATVECEWLTIDEVAVVTRLSRSTIRRRISDGSLPSSKVGRSVRVHHQHIDEFMRGRAA